MFDQCEIKLYTLGNMFSYIRDKQINYLLINNRRHIDSLVLGTKKQDLNVNLQKI